MKSKDRRKQKTQQDYAKISQMYQTDFDKDYEHFDFYDQLLQYVNKQGIDKNPIIDLGTGTGTVIEYLATKGAKNLIGIDMTPEFCKILQDKHTPNTKVICKEITQYLKDLQPESVAAFTANYSLIHIPDEEINDVLKNIYKALVPKGIFVMSCHKGEFKGMEQEPYQSQKDKRLQEDGYLETYMNYFKEEELKQLIHGSRLKLIEMKTFETKIVPGEINVPKIWLSASKSS